MKKKSLTYAAISFMMILCSRSFAQAQYELRGSLKGISSGMVQLLAHNERDRSTMAIDSGIITNGLFRLKGSITEPQMVTLKIEPGNWSCDVFVENTLLAVTADTTGARHFDDTAYGYTKGAIITSYTETGSKNFADWMKYHNDPGQKQYDSLFNELWIKYKAAGADIDAQYKVKDQIDSVMSMLYTWQKKKIDDYVNQNPSSVAGAYMFHQWYRSNQGHTSYPELADALEKFKGDAKASSYYQDLEESRIKLQAVQLGNTAPDFTLLMRDSSKFTLSSTRGKYILIDFWASWCHPCRQAIPHWKTVYQKYHDKGFDIVSVSNDNKRKNWIKAMDEEKMPWMQVDDEFPKKNMPATVANLYMNTFIPFYVLLDKEGKILVYTGDEEKIDLKLKEIFRM